MVIWSLSAISNVQTTILLNSKLFFMKKLLVIFTVLSSFYTANSFAQNKMPKAVTQSLQTSFKDVKEANWSVVNNLYKAEFILDGQNITAYLNEEGKLVASARNITALQLPILLQADLKNSYTNYVLTNLLEVDDENGITYYVTAENGTKTLQLKSVGYGVWNMYKS